MFGFHDEEIVICSPGWKSGVHLAARLFVPAACPGVGGCPGVVIAHGFGFNKEITLPDMYTAAGAGLYVLSYDVRGQGASGGQATFLGRDDIADQAAVLGWWHENVRPAKTAVYGISQGGWLAWTAAIFNCGATRAARFDSRVPCDAGGRWVDAVVPVQGPTGYLDDGTCSWFQAQVAVETRLNPALAQGVGECLIEGRQSRVPGVLLDVARRYDRIDVPVYAITSFYDRLVPPRLTTAAYEQLRRRAANPRDVLYGKDVRLTISNDAHGDVGGNLAVVRDLFAWIRSQIAGGPALRPAPVSIAQEWADGEFRLERGWPIAGTRTRKLYLARAEAGELGPRPGGGPEEMRNLPGEPLRYLSAPFQEVTEITGEPSVTIRVSSANPSSEGTGQLNLGLSEVTPDGSAHELSHARVGLTGLGPNPRAIRVPLSIAGHRIDPGNRLELTIAASDLAEAMPARGVDPFYVHHDAGAPSWVTIPIVPVTRRQPAGTPPEGAAYTSDPLGAICETFGLPC